MTDTAPAPKLDVGPISEVEPNKKKREYFPYLMLVPASVLILFVLGYPIFRMITLSLQQARLRNLVMGDTPFIGFQNYQAVLTSSAFWEVVIRTIIFTAACVFATMVIGMLITLLIHRIGSKMRLLVTVGLLLAWATPVITATQVWQWLFDAQFGVVNWALTSIGFSQFENYSWLAEPASLLTVAGVVVVWGALPFVVLTLYAGLSQVPAEMYEAAEVDGASAWKRFRFVTLPMLGPILTILAALQTIWDFRVFTQVFVLQKSGGVTADTNLIGIYAYRISFSANNFGYGAAISVIMVLILATLSVWYVRRMVKEVEGA